MLPTPVVKDVVLLGGGHSHVEVMRSFGMRPAPGARLTLITKDVQTPYSGMLPGYVSGFYSYDDVHIDLRRLARFAQCRLIHAEATGLDLKNRHVMLRGRPPIKYDVLSIDIGSSPENVSVPGAREYTTAVKPISTFISRLHALLDKLKTGEQLSQRSSATSDAQSVEIRPEVSRHSSSQRRLGDRGFCVVVVGGGAGGVELAFAIKHRLLKEAEQTERVSVSEPIVKLVTQKQILKGYPPAVRKAVLKLFEEKEIEVFEDSPVAEVTEDRVSLEDGRPIYFDGCLWCTQASAAPWIKTTGLDTDERGFIRTNDFLQPFHGPAEVFAAGDIATSVTNPRPKAGVFAVRQGPPLANNIRRFLQGEELVPFAPQTTYLSLISTGDKSCVASKGWLFWQGPSMWKLKDNIDRAFMYKYSRDLPDMEKMDISTAPLDQATASNLLERQAAVLAKHSRMRCAGCGGKIGMRVLQRVLSTMHSSEEVPDPGNVYDDAAILTPPAKGHVMLQTTDFLRSFISDPYLFGQITALHCFSDIYAMGGQPLTVLATAVVPFAIEEKMEMDLTQVLLGAKKACDDVNCKIVGGHTAEGLELSLGFAVTGSVPVNMTLKKRGAGLNQALVLTKALGTGMILAAEMRGKAQAPWVKAAVDSMLISNGPAVQILQKFEATACTDVTGFGLLGHLQEMLTNGEVSLDLSMEAIPVLPGSETCSRSGWLSSLHPQNKRVENFVENYESIKYSWELPVMVDPQTSGGLLAFVPVENAEQCIQALHAAGLTSASIIGYTKEMTNTKKPTVHVRQSQESV